MRFVMLFAQDEAFYTFSTVNKVKSTTKIQNSNNNASFFEDSCPFKENIHSG